MDEGEDHLGYYDIYPEREYMDKCIYCSEEDEDLNVVHYAINEKYDVVTLAINPKPCDKIVVPDGYTKRIEMVCDSCLKDNYTDA